jgi:hypothetical protein
MVIHRKLSAGIIPTALARYQGLNSVVTTDSLPQMGFSAPSIAQAIKDSLINGSGDS